MEECSFTRDFFDHVAQHLSTHSLSPHSLILHIWQKDLEVMCSCCDDNGKSSQANRFIHELISCMPDVKEERIVTYLIQKLSSAILCFLIMFSHKFVKVISKAIMKDLAMVET